MKDTINKLLDENYIIDNKFCTKYYRLLAKCKTERDSSISQLKDIPRNEINEKNYISYSAKHSKSKNKPSNESSPRGKEGYKQDIKNNSCIFEKKKCSYFEKKIFKEIDFIDFLKNNRTISNNTYKKVIRKKYGLRIATPVLFFLLLLILMIIDISLGLSFEKSLLISLVKWNQSVLTSEWFTKIYNLVKNTDWLSKSPLWSTIENLTDVDKQNGLLGRLIGVPLYFLPFLILGVTLIIALIYYHKKVKKYEKIKFKKR
ncbi:Plasmodium exported protein (Pm-fam-a like), unknown function [Plasmodium malariae]|uniref:Fam-l protein n=1 Tax=Plasmodium malariae TaxID=5858 RepID=A0A1A8X3W6_PLAMA|nr:Plasmodium exported protein (Pm-fam-a like), unknown function [Plasmodium malariae]